MTLPEDAVFRAAAARHCSCRSARGVVAFWPRLGQQHPWSVQMRSGAGVLSFAAGLGSPMISTPRRRPLQAPLSDARMLHACLDLLTGPCAQAIRPEMQPKECYSRCASRQPLSKSVAGAAPAAPCGAAGPARVAAQGGHPGGGASAARGRNRSARRGEGTFKAVVGKRMEVLKCCPSLRQRQEAAPYSGDGAGAQRCARRGKASLRAALCRLHCVAPQAKPGGSSNLVANLVARGCQGATC